MAYGDLADEHELAHRGLMAPVHTPSNGPISYTIKCTTNCHTRLSYGPTEVLRLTGTLSHMGPLHMPWYLGKCV